MSFAMSCGFNIIGNDSVRRLQRHGLKADGCYGKTDNLHIYYDGNRIKSVLEDADAVTQYGSMDYPGGHRELAFEYDSSGSLVKDESRGITSIEYDSFGNPLRIDYKSGNYTRNVYSATGEKLKSEHRKNMLQAVDMPGAVQTLSLGAGPETVFPGQPSDRFEIDGLTRMEYRGPVVWRNGRIDMVRFPGGYATVGDSVVFHYYTQDYLGNNRAVVNGMTGEVEQTVAYYPYGGIIPDLSAGLSRQAYKFGGKELITANGLNEYDFGARQYYQAVPHFTRIDPMCEKYYWLSPYLYCANNPVNLIDPTGKIWENPEDIEKLVSNVNNRIEHLTNLNNEYQSSLDNNKNLTDEDIKMTEQLMSENNQKVSLLNRCLDTIETMGADPEHLYNIESIDRGEVGKVTRGDDNRISIYASSDALLLHEITHVGQSLKNGKLIFKNNILSNAASRIGPQIGNEIVAYSTQFAMSPSDMPLEIISMRSINASYLKHIIDPKTGISLYDYIP